MTESMHSYMKVGLIKGIDPVAFGYIVMDGIG